MRSKLSLYWLVFSESHDIANSGFAFLQGQVVTATLVPGNLAVLGNFQSTGSAILDLQGKVPLHNHKEMLTSASYKIGMAGLTLRLYGP